MDTQDTMTIQEAAKWLGRMASADGVFTPRERKTLKEFADTYGINFKYLCRYVFSIANDVAEPEVEYLSPSEYKGRKFEDFIVSLCADKSRFRLLAWRSDKIVDGTYAAENLLPDLHLRHKLDNQDVEYFVECKYRSAWPEGGVDLSEQFLRYHFAAKRQCIDLFIALGVGGTASNPDELYIVPEWLMRFDKRIDPIRFKKCLCPKTPYGFHQHINRHFKKTTPKTAK